MLNQLVGSFAEAVLWWIAGSMKHTPEEITQCYLTACTLESALDEHRFGRNPVLQAGDKENARRFARCDPAGGFWYH